MSSPAEHTIPEDISTQVFVGKLPPTITEEKLIEYFSAFGPVQKAYIKRDPWTDKSRGFAFVNFESADSAALALGTSEHIIDGQAIGLRTAEDRRHAHQENQENAMDKKRLWVGGLQAETSEEDVMTYFSQFGEVSKVDLKSGGDDRKSFAFVSFVEEEVARTALEFAPHLLGDQTIEVKRPNPRRTHAFKGKGKGDWNNQGWGGYNSGNGMGMNPAMMMNMMAMMSMMKGKGKGKGMGMGKGGRYAPY